MFYQHVFHDWAAHLIFTDAGHQTEEICGSHKGCAGLYTPVKVCHFFEASTVHVFCIDPEQLTGIFISRKVSTVSFQLILF